jgi:hypothetical protein
VGLHGPDDFVIGAVLGVADELVPAVPLALEHAFAPAPGLLEAQGPVELLDGRADHGRVLLEFPSGEAEGAAPLVDLSDVVFVFVALKVGVLATEDQFHARVAKVAVAAGQDQ